MGHEIVPVGELVRYEYVWIFGGHSLCGLHAFFYAVADVSVIMDESDFSAVLGNQITSFCAYRVRHYDYGSVTLYCRDQRKAYSLVAACRLNDYSLAGGDKTAFFSCGYHFQGGPCLDGTSYIKAFILYQNLSVFRSRKL